MISSCHCTGTAPAQAPKSNGNGADPTPKDDAKTTALTPREKAAVEKLLNELRKQPEVAPAPSKTTARLTVNLPSNARLYVDNTECPLTSATRSFNTPALQPGKKYYYTLRAEVNQNGQTMAQTQRVFVEAGQQVTVTLGNLKAIQTAAR